ncbi:hypothetical protein LCGC14_0338480 [marine sediment metagenome]|uniref:Uncharacterized protein n=1 Tax=marine sediment metagenome TaxID=412755 RepID=A0A0F9TK22_9ZZZZ
MLGMREAAIYIRDLEADNARLRETLEWVDNRLFRETDGLPQLQRCYKCSGLFTEIARECIERIQSAINKE